MTPAPTSTSAVLSQDDLKTLVGQAALQYVVPGEIVGVGTGSTVNFATGAGLKGFGYLNTSPLGDWRAH